MKKILTLTLALTLLSACSSSHKGQLRRLLTVEVSEPATGRADSLHIFQMNYENNQFIIEKQDGTWGTLSWPRDIADDQKIDFYAYNSGTFHYNEGNPYITYTADELLRSQKDLLVATHKQTAYSDADGTVSLCVTHACAIVHFYIATNSNSSDSITVNSVVLRHVKKQGNYHYNTSPHWTDLSNEGDYTLTSHSHTHTLYIIPQPKDSILLEVSYTAGGTAKTKTLPLTGEWQMGKEDKVIVEI